MGKPPGFFVYTADWRKDPAVQSCSLSARGLWWELLCVMWECPMRGVLLTGPPWYIWSARDISLAIGCPPKLAEKLLNELLVKGVASQAENGAIFCRRMVADYGGPRAREFCGNPRAPSCVSISTSNTNQETPGKTRRCTTVV